MAFVEVRDLSKVYVTGAGDLPVLSGMALDIEEGEFVALMGPSGSGKTTLLNILAGIDDATSGSVVIDGTDIGRMSDAKRTAWRTRSIGYIFQTYNLLPVLSAYENVELPLLLLPLSKKERREHVTAALEAVDLLDRAHHYPRQLSGGQEQRVAIARAIITDPKILVADEPTGNLDSATGMGIMDLLSRLHKEHKKTIVMVSHDARAAKFADRILNLEDGRAVSALQEVK